MDGGVEKLRLDPARGHRHHMNVAVAQLHGESAGEAHHIGLGGAVDIDVGHRLPRGVGGQVDDVAACGDVGQAQVGHGGEGRGVEVDDVQLLVSVHLRESAEEAKARGVNKHLHRGGVLIEEGFQRVEGTALQEVEGQGTDGGAAQGAQLLQALGAAGDDPDLVEGEGAVDGGDEFPAHAGGCAGDDGDVHRVSSCGFLTSISQKRGMEKKKDRICGLLFCFSDPECGRRWRWSPPATG